MELISLSFKREEKMKVVVLILMFATLLKVNSAGITGEKWTKEDEKTIRGKLQWIMENSGTAIRKFKRNYKKRNGENYPNKKDFLPAARKVSLKRLTRPRQTNAQSVTLH